MTNMPKSVPARWLDYKPFGTIINGTKILPFKVPLKETVCNNLEPEQRFTTSILVQAFPRLKCIVDLTNTDRYYHGKEFTSRGIRYEKIWVRGREVPSMNEVKKFFKLMDDFLSTSAEEDIIGVHCTHGINRSGYLICRYLVQQLGWDPEECIKTFAEARGYSIERPIYINALRKTPRNEKIDTSLISLESLSDRSVMPSAASTSTNTIKRPARPSSDFLGPDVSMMGPPGFAPLRRGFVSDGPFPPQPFGFGGPPPRFRPIPPIPPLPGPPPMFGPRPFRYGPPPRPAMPSLPHRPGFPIPGFPPPPCPNRTPGGSRLPPGPPSRLPKPKMPPPPPPPPSRLRPTVLRRLQTQKRKQHIRNSIVTLIKNRSSIFKQDSQSSRSLPKLLKEQDFTVDTFEENLLAISGHPHRRPTKGRFSQAK
ncbi:uncharacterized protein LOC116430766 [Nomia melanderi]|uniref:uncharacterized protein LOC116430766 n=1 Tax=Nomia melanderi TaxID=2448451 RepID=UPI003FCCD6FB